MNELGLNLLWLAGQVTLLCLTALAVFAFVGRKTLTNLTTSWLAIVLILGLSVMAFSPWPRWTWEPLVAQPPSQPTDQAMAQQDPTTESGLPSAATPVSIDTNFESPVTAAVKGFVAEFGASGLQEPTVASDVGLTWSGWVAWAAIVLLLFGAGRFLLGWLVVRRCVERSSLVEDARATEMLDILLAKFSSPKSVQLRQSNDIAAPATTGWKQPLILLPSDWTEWTTTELQTVLAHEVAHVVNADSWKWLVAQCSLLLNFYHPLVHMLVNRLRLEQELAADALAATVTGGSQRYLTTLAELAVGQPSRKQAWPAQAFFPASGTLLRRIEMLRDHSGASGRSVWRIPCVALLLIVSVAVAGLRRPVVAAEPLATTAEPQPANAVADEYPTEMIPADAALVVGFRPAELASQPAMNSIRDIVENELKESDLSIKMSDLQSVLLISQGRRSDGPPNDVMGPPVTVIRFSASADSEATIKQMAGRAKVVSPHDIPDGRETVACVVDAQTVVMGPAGVVRKLLLAAMGTRPTWVESFGSQNGQIHVALDPSYTRPGLQAEIARQPNPLVMMFAPLWQEPALISLTGSIQDSMKLNLTAATANSESATKVKTSLEGVLPMAKAMLVGVQTSAARAPAEQREMIESTVEIAEQAMANAVVTQSGNNVNLTLSCDAETTSSLIAMSLPAIQSARTAARKTQSMNNLKQLLLAFHNYHSVYGHFPPQHLLGPDGKTKHSWRVAILPFIEQAPLYEQYKLDEPWDSPANMKVLEQMPPVYAKPSWPAGETRTAYFGFAGKNTGLGEAPGENNAGNRLRTFVDGTSNTIMLIEADRQIPWTKPEDIPYDENKLPELGAIGVDFFIAALADGSVRQVSKAIKAEVLRPYITRNDRQIPPEELK